MEKEMIGGGVEPSLGWSSSAPSGWEWGYLPALKKDKIPSSNQTWRAGKIPI